MEHQPLAVKTQNLNHGASREFPQIQGLNCNQYPEKQLDAGHSIVHQNIGHRGDQADPGAVRLCLQVAPGYPLAALSMNRPMAAASGQGQPLDSINHVLSTTRSGRGASQRTSIRVP